MTEAPSKMLDSRFSIFFRFLSDPDFSLRLVWDDSEVSEAAAREVTGGGGRAGTVAGEASAEAGWFVFCGYDLLWTTSLSAS